MGSIAELPRKRPVSLSGAAKRNRLELLVALRDKIAADIDAGVPPRDLAALSRRLMDLAKDIEALSRDSKGDEVGQAAAVPDAPWPG